MEKTRILIVDDHAMVRLGLAQAIRQQPDMCVVGEAANGREAIRLANELHPDVVTMDYKLPGQDGVAVIRELRLQCPSARILLLSIYETQESVWRAMDAGAAGYCSKAVEIEEMITAIRGISAGREYLSPGLSAKLRNRQQEESLSGRELDVLQRLAKGESNKEIMNSLALSQSTVKHHLERIFTKLGVSDRTQAIAAAIRRGIIELD